MAHSKKEAINSNTITILLVVSIALIAFLGFYNTLDYSFAGSGSLPLIKNNRIHSFQDILRILSEPLDAGFIESGWLYYRPTDALSFSMDYSIWGLNPFGYHLTNLLLHILVAVMVFFIARSLTKGRMLTAWISAVIFLAHPVVMETLPVISRRHNILGALFLLISVFLFIKYVSNSSCRYTYLFLSLFSYIVSMGAKESGILLLPILFGYLFVFQQDKPSFIKNITHAFKGIVPYIITSFVFIMWRNHILGEIGGKAGEHLRLFNLPTFMKSLVWTVKAYLIKLFYPFDVLHLGSSFDFFRYKTFLFACILLIVILYHRRKIFSFLSGSDIGRALSFLLVWILLPLSGCIYLNIDNETYLPAHRCMYAAVVSFSIILSILFTESIRTTIMKFRECHASGSLLNLALFYRVIGTIFIIMISLSLIAYSPLVRKHGEWEAISRITETYLAELTEILPELPNNAVIYTYNLPVEITSFRDKLSHSSEMGSLRNYSIKSWIDMVYPENQMKVADTPLIKLAEPPQSMHLNIIKDEDNNVKIIIVYDDKKNTTYPSALKSSTK